jgi:hypothetical protein
MAHCIGETPLFASQPVLDCILYMLGKFVEAARGRHRLGYRHHALPAILERPACSFEKFAVVSVMPSKHVIKHGHVV